MQTVPITTDVVSANPTRARCTRYNITVYHLYTGNSYHGMGDNILHSQQVRNNRILRIKTVYFNNMAIIIGPGIVFRDI
jgi:hypothetical protein